jgi:hypothetical protein
MDVMEDKKMTIYDAVMIAEGEQVADTGEMQEAWQMLVDSGLAWSLQGWFGREATRLIEAGVIQPFPRP